MHRRSSLLLAAAALLCVSPAHSDTLTSTVYPIVVEHDAADLALAQEVLVAAESAWKRLIIDLGYAEPTASAASGGTDKPGIRIVVGDTGMSAGSAMASWGHNIPDTPRCDCSSYITIERTTAPTQASVAEGVFHEMVHATQYAVDCTEPPSAYEGFAMAAVRQQFPSSAIAAGVIKQFQLFPQYPLDYWTMTMPCDNKVPCFPYQLGEGLFPVFLMEHFGASKPEFLAELYAGASQDGTTTIGPPHPSCSESNVPDFWGAMDAVLRSRGSSLLEAFSLFAEWRAVTGTHDDGHHFHQGDQIAEPAVGGSVAWPASSTLSTSAFEWGTRYVEIQQAPEGAVLRVVVEADSAASWMGRVLVWKSGQPVASFPLAFVGSKGEVELSWSAEVQRALVAVSQLDDGSHDVSAMDYDNERSFTLRVEEVEQDAGAEAGEDAPASGDGGSVRADPAAESGGCGCWLEAQDTRAWWGTAVLLAAAAWSRRRLRGRARPSDNRTQGARQ